MTATASTSAQWHAVTPSTRPLSLSILELTPLALTLSLTLASSSSTSQPQQQIPHSAFKRRRRPRKTDSDDESTAVEADDEQHRDSPFGGSGSGSGLGIPGGWPSEVGRSFKDLLSHGVVVSVNGQPWSRIVAHASDPDVESEGDEAEDEWDDDWENAGKSDEEGAEEGLGAEGMQRRRPRIPRFKRSARNAVGDTSRRKEGRREKIDHWKDRAVVVVYGLSPAKEYEIELRVVGMGGAENDSAVSNSVLIPPPQGASLHPRSRANSLRSRQHPRSRSNSTTTPATSSENQTPSRRGSPTLGNISLPEAIAPTAVLSIVDTQTAQLRHLVASASAEKEHLSAQIKEARRASQRAEAALRQEIDAVKKSTEKAGSMDLRAKQKALALQEQVKQGWAGAEAADVETGLVEGGMGELESLLATVMKEVDGLRGGLAEAREKEDEVREKDKRIRTEEEKKLNEVVGKVEKLRMKKEKKEAEKMELERRIEDLERQRLDIERQGEEDAKRMAAGGGHWGAHGGHWDPHHESHHRLTTHPSLSNIGAQGGYGAGPAYRPRGAQGYQPRYPSAGAVRPGPAPIIPNVATQPSPTNFYPSSSSTGFRPPPAGPVPTKSGGSSSPAIGNRAISSTSTGVNASAAPFVPSAYTTSPSTGSSAAYDAHTTLMPAGMQHRIYLPSTQSQSGNYQSVRPRPTPTFHPPPSVLAEQAAQAQARNSPTTTSSPSFPPLPGASPGPGQSAKPASAAPGSGPSLASIITRAVLSPTSSLAAGGSMSQGAPGNLNSRRVSPPETSLAGVSASGGGLRSPPLPINSTEPSPISPGPSSDLNRSASPTPIPTPISIPNLSSNTHPFSQYSGSQFQSNTGRVSFAQNPNPSSSADNDFPPLSPSGPWQGLNPSIGSRVRGDSGDAGVGGIGQLGYGAGISRTQTPPAAVWGGGGERVGSPLGIGGDARQGQSRKQTE